MSNKSRLPVLLLHYNRPENLRKQLDIIFNHNSDRKIYISIDGPNSTEQSLAVNLQLKKIVQEFEELLQISTQYFKTNLGCRNGVISGINWFFEHNHAGIIIEDDIAFDTDFLSYCDANEDYLNDYILSGFCVNNSSCNWLSLHGTVWGWACHRKYWHQFRAFQPKWTTYVNVIKTATCVKERINLLSQICQNTSSDIDTWDFDWSFFRRSQKILTLMPKTSFTTNIGFEDGTHTKSKKPDWMPTLLRSKDETFRALLLSTKLDQNREFHYFSRKNSHLTLIHILVALVKLNIVLIKRELRT